MGLKYIFGSPGTGKTNFCIEELISANEKNGFENLIYIVPEQFTMESEKKLVNRTTGKAIMRIQVLSFQRLSFHVFNEQGGADKTLLEDVGKGMLLRKIINEIKNELSFFTIAADKQGFMEQLFDTITEFYQYNITLEQLNEIIPKIHNNESLRLKMIDLYKILEKYQIYQSENYISNDERLDILAEKIEKSSLVKNSRIWIDGFNGFTPQEYKVIEKLLITSKNVSIALTIDYNKITKEQKTSEYDCFFEIRNTIRIINNLAHKNNMYIEEPIKLSKTFRFDNNMEIKHLEENYMKFIPKQYQEEPKNIKIYPCDNIYDEIENIASKIIMIIKEKQYKFSDIGILACSLDDYSKNIRTIFQKNNIPVFIDIKTDILSHPLIELIRSMFSIISDNFSYESIFRFLKTNFINIERKNIDIIENYVLAYGIKGSKWKKVWEYGFSGNYEVFEKNHINEMRENILNILSPIIDRYKTGKRYKIKDLSTHLFEFLETLNISQTINEWANDELNNGNIQSAREHSQVWGKFIQVMNKVVEILGEETSTIEEYSKIIDAGFAESDLGIIPPSLEQVTVGDLRRSRMPDIKVLFVLGVNEGVLPSKIKDIGLLNDEERIFLEKNHNTHLIPNGLIRAYEEQFLVYTILLKPSEMICFSYCLGGLDGKAFLPSTIIKKIKKVFPKLDEIQGEKSDFLISSRFAYNDLIIRLREFLENGHIPDIYKDVYNCLLNDETYKERIREITNSYFDVAKDVILEKKTIELLYGNQIKTSVSRLEKYIKCPFSYFAQYNLKASVRKIYEIESINLGNLFHDVLDGFSKKIQKDNINWREIKKVSINEIASECVDLSLLKETNEIFKNSSQYEFFAARAKEIAVKSIFAVIEHMRSGEFEFSYSEVAFDENDENPMGPIEVELNDDVIMYIEGRIDRVDMLTVGESRYVKIIDYKSGNKVFSFPEIFYGLQLQLIVYLDAFIKKYKGKFKNTDYVDILPAAVLYFKIDNPLINFENMPQKDNIELALYKKFKMSGVVLEEIDIIQKIDNNFESKSDIIPVGIKSNATLKKLPINERPLTEASSTLSSDNFQKLMDFSFEKIIETGKRILSGETPAKPFKYGNLTGCSYCEYKSICCFDAVMDAGDYNVMKKIKTKQAITEIFE